MIDYDKAIERLRKVRPRLTSDVGEAFMGGVRTSSEFRDALVELLETARDSIALPMDMDGVVIRVGDRLQHKLDEWEWGKPFVVFGMTTDIDSDEWEIYNENGCVYNESTCRHYCEPVIEDVLREFANKVYATHYVGMHMSIDEIIEAYAKRLELREEA